MVTKVEFFGYNARPFYLGIINMRIITLLSIVTALFVSFESEAGKLEGAKIKEIRQRGYDTLIHFDKPFDQKCKDGGAWGFINLDDTEKNKRLISLILTAAAANKTVTVNSGSCANGAYHQRITEVFVSF